jgi:hypothetical protein
MPLLTQSGHERAAFAAVHGPDLLYLISVGLEESPMMRREFIARFCYD